MAEQNKQFTDQHGNSQLLIDSDTIVDTTGKRRRLDGFDGRETAKLFKNEDGEWEYSAGQIGSDIQTDAVAQIIEEGGFTNVNDTGKIDKSEGKRDIAGLVNKDGETLKSVLFRSGIADIDEYSTIDDIENRAVGVRQRALHGNDIDPYFDIAQEYKSELLKETFENGNYFKTDAINESYYDPDVHDDVLWRDHSRTIDNKARGTWQGAGIALRSGWEGIKEGFFGYADAFGSSEWSPTIGKMDGLASWGRKGVRRSRERMFDNPEIVLQYQDVDGIRTGFQYLLNNAAMSAPYMVTTFGAFAAAVPASGALTLMGAGATASRLAALGIVSLPNSLVYAGQTWNEMEMGYDENGLRKPKGTEQFLAATTSGVLQASLERMGISRLLPKQGLLTTSGKAKIISALKKKNPGMSTAMANDMLKRNLAREQARMAKDLGVVLDPDNIARWSASEAGKTALASAGIESFTEIGQELTQAATAMGFSDTKYTMSELGNRIVNAGLAGGLLGGTIGTAGNIHSQANREMYRADIAAGRETRYGIMARVRNKAIQSGEKIKSVWQQVKDKDKEWDASDSGSVEEDADTIVVYDAEGNPEVRIVDRDKKGKIVSMRKPGVKTDALGIPIVDNDGNNINNDSTPYNEDAITDPTDLANNVDGVLQKSKYKNIIAGIKPRRMTPAFKDAVNTLKKKDAALKDLTVNQLQALQSGLRDKGVLTASEAKLDAAIIKAIASKTEFLDVGAGDDEGWKAHPLRKKRDPRIKKKFNKQTADDMTQGANEYVTKSKGIWNSIKNSQDLMDLLTNATIGFSKLFRAAINVAMPMAKLVQSKIAMDIYSRVAGMAMNAYHHGRSFKEYADDIVKKLKLYYDEQRIADLLGYKLNAKNIVKISKELRKFGSTGGYKALLFYAATARKNDKGMSARDLFQVYAQERAVIYKENERRENAKLPKIPFDNEFYKKWAERFSVFGLDAKEKTIDLVNEYGEWLEEKGLWKKSDNRILQSVQVDENLLFTKADLDPYKKDKQGNLKQPPVSDNEAISLLVNEYMKVNIGMTFDEAKRAIIARKKVLFGIATQLKRSYDDAHRQVANAYDAEHKRNVSSDPDSGIAYDYDYWWRHQGFDWRSVRRNPDKFKSWLRNLPQHGGPSYTETQIEAIYNSIARDGDDQVHLGLATEADSEFSLVGGKAWRPWSFSPSTAQISSMPGFDEWVSNNIFETLNRTQIETGKYVSVTDYFGEGGHKLHRLFKELREKEGPTGSGLYTDQEIDQFAYYIKSIIDSTHGNFKRIKDPRLAALNKFITTWTIFTGLPLSMISSIPETAMVFFNIKDDDDFKAATKQLTLQISQAFDNSLKAEVQKTEKLVKQIGLQPNQNTVVDRLATGTRDVAFMRMHETFFRAIGIQKITQVQRRINAGFGIDYLKSSFTLLDTAPRVKIQEDSWYDSQVEQVKNQDKIWSQKENKMVLFTDAKKEERVREIREDQRKQKFFKTRGREDGDFDLDKFTEIELRTYNSLVELGINVERMDYLMRSLDTKLNARLFDILDTRDTVDPDTGEAIDSKKWLKERSQREMILSAIVKGKFDVDEAGRGSFKDISQVSNTLNLNKIKKNLEDKHRKEIQIEMNEYRKELDQSNLSQEEKNIFLKERLDSLESQYDDVRKDALADMGDPDSMSLDESIALIEQIKDMEQEINDEVETALYRFVNERVQLPQAANRPLFFQDPHYQIMTQFNGFISTFTANVIPKLYNSNLRKGTVKVKYDTFALMVMMIALGGASQYLKDLIKFGKPSPYMDMTGYIQRAMYSSGVLGQYERLVDIAYPLYPERHSGLDWLSNKVLGESGPGIRNIQNLVTSTGQLLEGNTEQGVSNLARSLPVVAPMTSQRHNLSDALHGKNPYADSEIYNKLFS